MASPSTNTSRPKKLKRDCETGTVTKREQKPQKINQCPPPSTLLSDIQYTKQYTYRVLTLDINGIESHNRIRMLEQFVHRHDVDIALLQEVTDGDKLICKGYHSTINIGTTGRGQAILHKLNIQLHRIERIPSGRRIAVYFDDACIVNIYAPSGTAKRVEKEEFFKLRYIRTVTHKSNQINLSWRF